MFIIKVSRKLKRLFNQWYRCALCYENIRESLGFYTLELTPSSNAGKNSQKGGKEKKKKKKKKRWM